MRRVIFILFSPNEQRGGGEGGGGGVHCQTFYFFIFSPFQQTTSNGIGHRVK